MSMAVVKNRCLVFNGKRYFRAGSEDIVLGSYGVKRRPLRRANYLEKYGNMTDQYLSKVESVPVDIDFDRSANFRLGSSVSVPGLGSISEDRAASMMRSAELKLVKVSAIPKDVVETVNKDRELFDYMTSGRRRRLKRIAFQIFTVVTAELSEQMDGTFSIDASGKIEGIDVSLGSGGGISQSSNVSLSKGTTFAYMLFQPAWNSRRRRKITTAVGGRDDQWGLN